MSTRTEEQIDDWESRSFTGGFSGLHELADAEFSGAVRAGGVRLFMLNGRVVGVFGGEIESFEGASGTIHEAPHPALPLLFAMQERGGSTQAKYYTNDTPISEADETLSSGGFTGYVELSENVLSGDYYLVYHGGRSMSVAFVGNNEQLVTGDEAQQRADDEVGIYEVMDVDVDVVDVPEPDDGGGESAPEPDSDPTAEPDPALDADPTREEPAADDAAPTEPASTEPAADDAASTESAVDDPSSTEPTSTGGDDTSPATDPAAAESTEAETAPVDSEPSPAETETTPTEPEAAQSDPEPEAGSSAADAVVEPTDEQVSEEVEWRETRMIPSLNPDRTSKANAGGTASASTPSSVTTTQSASGASRSSDETAATGETATNRDADDASGGTESQSESGLRAEVLKREDKIDRLKQRASQLESERDEVTRERNRLQDEVERLESEVQRLQTELEQGGSGGANRGRNLSRKEAIDGTNLFVRYSSKGGGTLEKAHAGSVDGEEVNQNLRIEHHTQFDASSVTVEGEPFETFLTNAIEYQFVEWTIEKLLYEIRDTGHESSLQDLFDVLPDIDRAELLGSVTVQYVEDGEEYRDQQTFDVVLRDRMGNPLIVANVNDSRDPATEGMMTSLVEQAEQVKATADELGAAFFVTASFFEPQALETTEEATSGGLLGGGSKESFVKLSRKNGFHLCLVETRGGEFHVNVPEL